MRRLLVLRPEPGAARTAAAARAAGLEAIAAPLFTVKPIAWQLPAGPFDALMLTSANAVRHGGDGLGELRHLAVHAVGDATADAARLAGFADVRAGSGDVGDLVAAMAAAGVTRALHLAGEVHRAPAEPPFEIVRVAVYRSVPADRLAQGAVPAGTVALIHSPVAGALFARLIDEAGLSRAGVAIVAISAAAAAGAGEGWGAVGVAARPTDAALLAIAADLCEEAPRKADERT